MTGSNTKPKTTEAETNAAAALDRADLALVDIQAIEARARQLRSAETARLLRQAWLTIGSLWRGPRRQIPAAKGRPTLGTSH